MKTIGHVRPYKSGGGATLVKPSIQLAMTMNEESEGFCLACGAVNEGVEPDARRYVCSDCGEARVYGAQELVLMGLTWDAS